MERTDATLERQTALLEMSRHWRQYENDLDAAVRTVVETATKVLDVATASIWFEDPASRLAVCHDQYMAATREHVRGETVDPNDFPAHAEALRGDGALVIGDAQRDPRNADIVEPFLKPLGIGAMMFVPIRHGGESVGVLSVAHVGGPREFSAIEQSSALFLASLVAQAHEAHHGIGNLSLLRAAFEATGAGILAISKSGSVSHYNQAFLDLWELPEALMGKDGDGGPRVQHIASRGTEPERMMERWKGAVADPTLTVLEVFETTDGRSVECTSLPQHVDGKIVGRVWSFRDVTYQRELEQELRKLSMHDGLTGLFNRRCAEEHLDKEIQRAKRSKQPLSVALLDIDKFKNLNDLHGHAVGDQVLRALADDFRKRLRATDLPCRWGGEEFLLILPDTDEIGARTVINDLRKIISRERRDLPGFTFSAGVAQYKDHTPDALVDLADTRMYQAKQSGRNRVV
jgi:diguanylate cyclase (GGDEF)-like protein